MTLRAAIETLPLARPFAISRGARTEQTVVVARLRYGRETGVGECSPYARYGETPEGVRAEIEAMAGWLRDAMEDGPRVARDALMDAMAPGAARNAIDCALWDAEAKATARRVWDLAGVAEPAGLRSVLTVGLDAPDAMAEAARAVPSDRIKVKLGAGDGADADRMAAVRAARPDAVIVVDANEGWGADDLHALMAAARDAGVAMVEQPLPQGGDGALDGVRGAFGDVRLCADESCRQDVDFADLARRYDVANLKLDKTGGLTHALERAEAARAAGMAVMVGCMVGSSWAMAPAAVLAAACGAEVVDLDGPTWLSADREPGMVAADGAVRAPDAALWG